MGVPSNQSVECACSWPVFLYFCSLAFWVITTQARYGVTNRQSGFVVFQNFRQKKVIKGWMMVLELVVAISELGNKWHARSTWIDQCKKGRKSRLDTDCPPSILD